MNKLAAGSPQPPTFPTFEGVNSFIESADYLPWIMIPLGESRSLKLVGGKGYHCDESAELPFGLALSGVRNSGPDLVFTLTGNAPTFGYVHFKKGGGQQATLGCLVTQERTVNTAFFLLEDSTGRMRTTRSDASLAKVVEEANAILRPMANVVIKPIGKAERLPVSGEFGNVLSNESARTLKDQLVPKGNANARFNVFCIWGKLETGEGVTFPEDKFCLIPDVIAEDKHGHCLAHETGHLLLGRDHFHRERKDRRNGHSLCAHSPNNQHLMFYGLDFGGTLLDIRSAREMNDAAAPTQ